MVLKIERGLFSSDFVDYHAVLGISINADPKSIRKRYLKIAKQLHPDSTSVKSDAEKELARELLSKLVNPAYEKLSQEKGLTEYMVVLKLKGEQLTQQLQTASSIEDGVSDAARQLVKARDVDEAYNSALQELSAQQYDLLPASLETIGQISELNMVYLLRQQPASQLRSAKSSNLNDGRVPPRPEDKTPPSRPPRRQLDLFERAVQRAIEFESQGNFPQALLELREAIQMNPSHPKVCEGHSRIGAIYLKLKQPTMAKIHFKKALDLNPKDELATAGLRHLGLSGNPSGQGQADQSKGKSGKGGFLGGLFGGKKK